MEKKAVGMGRDWNRLTNIAALVTALSGLLAACGATYRSYDSMTQDMDKIAKDLQATHQELDELRTACGKLPSTEIRKEPTDFKPPTSKTDTGASKVIF